MFIVRGRKNSVFANKLEENRGNSKAYWTTLRQILPAKSKIPGTEKLVVEDIELYDKLDIVNSFNEYFTIVASTLLENRPSPGIQQPVPQSQTPSQIFSLPIIDEKDIEYYESHKDHLYRQHSSESSEDCSTAYQYSASQEIQSIIQH